jgi:2-iminobutanoate/2-iminopropanoate deaminase
MEYFSDAPNAPKAIGPYSQATRQGKLVFLSGQVPLVPETGTLVPGGIEDQTEQVMKNLQAVLSHLGLGFGQVAKSTIYLTDFSNFKTVNAIYEKWLAGSKPARATVQVAALPLGASIEIEMTAVA